MSTIEPEPEWACPVCAGVTAVEHWPVADGGTEGGVDPVLFRPSAESYGRTAATVVRCLSCGHGYLGNRLDPGAVDAAYTDAVDEVSLREEAGQVATADRALSLIEQWRPPGRLVDLGCWTGSFLVAAERRGWRAEGVEPSSWASGRARARGLQVRSTTLDGAALAPGSFDAVVVCDVLEHLLDPGAALRTIHDALAHDGVVYVTVPDAGSAMAKVLGRRWWSVLPMHVQYFTRSSLGMLLRRTGFDVVELSTHPKVFSLRYYGERVVSLLPGAQQVATRLLDRLPSPERLVAPDLRDRLQLVARRRDPGAPPGGDTVAGWSSAATS